MTNTPTTIPTRPWEYKKFLLSTVDKYQSSITNSPLQKELVRLNWDAEKNHAMLLDEVKKIKTIEKYEWAVNIIPNIDNHIDLANKE